MNEILNNRYSPIVTPWEEVNLNQQNLIEQLRTASNEQQYQKCYALILLPMRFQVHNFLLI